MTATATMTEPLITPADIDALIREEAAKAPPIGREQRRLIAEVFAEMVQNTN